MKDLEFLKCFLGIKVAKNAFKSYLSQWKYAIDIISETGLSSTKPRLLWLIKSSLSYW